MKALVLALALILSTIGAAGAQSPSPSPERLEFERAVLMVGEGKADMKAAFDDFYVDALARPIVEKALSDNLLALEGLVVYDCFAEWYALQYAALVVVSTWFISIDSPEQLAAPADGSLKAAVWLTSLASVIEASVVC